VNPALAKPSRASTAAPADLRKIRVKTLRQSPPGHGYEARVDADVALVRPHLEVHVRPTDEQRLHAN
jgi:hypothetical protein